MQCILWCTESFTYMYMYVYSTCTCACACKGLKQYMCYSHTCTCTLCTCMDEASAIPAPPSSLQLAHAIWMGRWNPRQDKEPSKKDEVAYKEFLIAKYERKQWYRSAAEVKREREKESGSGTPPVEPKLLPPPSTKVTSCVALLHVYILYIQLSVHVQCTVYLYTCIYTCTCTVWVIKKLMFCLRCTVSSKQLNGNNETAEQKQHTNPEAQKCNCKWQ